MAKVKIMINFHNKNVIHSTDDIGSDPYQVLLKKGYQYVGDAKIKNGEIQFFWKANFFDPGSKYIRGTNIDEITT